MLHIEKNASLYNNGDLGELVQPGFLFEICIERWLKVAAVKFAILHVEYHGEFDFSFMN